MLLVIDYGKFGVRMFRDIFHLRWNGVNEYPGYNTAGGLSGKLPPKPFRLIIPDDTDHVTRFQPEAYQSQ
ncbi:hypothetical protein ES707_20526 [subsurface metagenome]